MTLLPPNRPDASDYEIERAPVTVRLIRLVTPEGRVRGLATSLLDPQTWPAADFAALYHQRWRIEEALKRIKHRLALEAVSGLSWLTHQQDLAAKVLSDNLSALLCLEALGERDGQISDHTPTFIRSSTDALLKINRTPAFAHVQQCLPRWLGKGVASAIDDLTRLLRHIADNVIRFMPDRSQPPPLQPKPHKAFASKAVM